MSKPQRMVVVSACAVAVAVLPVEWVVHVVDAAAPSGATSEGATVHLAWSLPIVALLVIIVGSLVTAARRLRRAAAHLGAVGRA